MLYEQKIFKGLCYLNLYKTISSDTKEFVTQGILWDQTWIYSI